MGDIKQENEVQTICGKNDKRKADEKKNPDGGGGNKNIHCRQIQIISSDFSVCVAIARSPNADRKITDQPVDRS